VDSIEAIRSRDPVTLDRVARDNVDALVRAARAAGLSRDEAWDAAQDTLLVFVRKADQYDGRASVRTWLLGILYRKVQELRRVGWREEAVEDADAAFDARFESSGRWAQPPSAEAVAAASQAMGWVEDCVRGLPERRRLAFVLRDVDQLETDEICKILDVSANNLGVLLFRARSAVRDCLEAKGLRGSDDVAL